MLDVFIPRSFGYTTSRLVWAQLLRQDITTPSTPNWKLVIKAETHNCTRKRKKNKPTRQAGPIRLIRQSTKRKKKIILFTLTWHHTTKICFIMSTIPNIRFRLYHLWISANTQHQCLQSLLIADTLMLRVLKISWLTTERETFSLKFTHLYSHVCDKILGITSFSLTTPLLLLCVKISTFLLY